MMHLITSIEVGHTVVLDDCDNGGDIDELYKTFELLVATKVGGLLFDYFKEDQIIYANMLIKNKQKDYNSCFIEWLIEKYKYKKVAFLEHFVI